MNVSFDHGFEGSITEDAYFAVKASGMGYTFDWIEGEILEKSPYSLLDFLKQRRRWVQGLILVATSRNLKRDYAGVIFR